MSYVTKIVDWSLCIVANGHGWLKKFLPMVTLMNLLYLQYQYDFYDIIYIHFQFKKKNFMFLGCSEKIFFTKFRPVQKSVKKPSSQSKSHLKSSKQHALQKSIGSKSKISGQTKSVSSKLSSETSHLMNKKREESKLKSENKQESEKCQKKDKFKNNEVQKEKEKHQKKRKHQEKEKQELKEKKDKKAKLQEKQKQQKSKKQNKEKDTTVSKNESKENERSKEEKEKAEKDMRLRRGKKDKTSRKKQVKVKASEKPSDTKERKHVNSIDSKHQEKHSHEKKHTNTENEKVINKEGNVNKSNCSFKHFKGKEGSSKKSGHSKPLKSTTNNQEESNTLNLKRKRSETSEHRSKRQKSDKSQAPSTELNAEDTVIDLQGLNSLFKSQPDDLPAVDMISKPVKTPERVQTESEEEESGILITDIERNRCVSGQSTEGLSTFQSLPATSPLSELPPPRLPETIINLPTSITSREITVTRAQPPASVQAQARKRKQSNEKGSGGTAGRAAVKKFKYKVGNNSKLYLPIDLFPNNAYTLYSAFLSSHRMSGLRIFETKYLFEFSVYIQ